MTSAASPCLTIEKRERRQENASTFLYLPLGTSNEKRKKGRKGKRVFRSASSGGEASSLRRLQIISSKKERKKGRGRGGKNREDGLAPTKMKGKKRGRIGVGVSVSLPAHPCPDRKGKKKKTTKYSLQPQHLDVK